MTVRRLPLLVALLGLAACADSRGAPPPRADDAPADTVRWRMVTDSVSGAVLPRILAPANARTAAVNRALDSLSASLRCDPDARGETDYESHAEVGMARDDVFSVHVRASFYCGGAHPTNGANLSVTFDLRTGRAVPFEALFADWERDDTQILRSIFPAHVAAAEAREERARTGVEEELACEDLYALDRLRETTMAYHLTPSAVMVEPQLPHVVHACGDLVAVPVTRLRAYAADGGLLTRLAGGGGEGAVPQVRVERQPRDVPIDPAACTDDGTEAARNACAFADHLAADSALNATYRAARDTMQTAERVALTGEQRAWLRFRDAACAFAADGFATPRPDGAQRYYDCLAGLARARTDELRGAAPAALPAGACDTARTQLDLNRCASDVRRAADAELNAVYRELRARVEAAVAAAPPPPEAEDRLPRDELLRDAQRAWIAFRDAACARETAPYEGGSIRPLVEQACLAGRTRRRTEQLREALAAEGA